MILGDSSNMDYNSLLLLPPLFIKGSKRPRMELLACVEFSVMHQAIYLLVTAEQSCLKYGIDDLFYFFRL